MKLLLAALLTSALAPAVAHADCATQTWIGTPSGTVIPDRGSLYVYDEGYRSLDTIVGFGDGVPHRWERTRISDTVVRIDYAAGLAPSVTTRVGWEDVTYAIDPRWTPPRADPRVLQYWHHQSEWACSHADSWMIQVDQPTAAFRVVFAPVSGVIEGPFEYIEPAKVGDDGRSVLEIGKHDCIGVPTIDPAILAAGGRLALFAIRFDGSEVPVIGLPARLRTVDMRTSDRGIVEAFGYHTLTPPSAPRMVTNAESGHAFLVIACAGAGLLFVGMLLAGRKRAPVTVALDLSAG